MTGQEHKTEVVASLGVSELVGGHAYVTASAAPDDALEIGMVIDLRDDAGHVYSAKVVDRVGTRWQLALQA